MLITVIPLQALKLLGVARDVSVLYAAIGLFALAFSLLIPILARRLQSGRFYALGGALLMVAPLALATNTLAGVAVALLLTSISGACLLNGINLLMMAHVAKPDLVRAESWKFFGGATAWLICPVLGVVLFEHAAPAWALGLSSAAGLSHVIYLAALGLMRAPTETAELPAAALRPWRNFARFLAQPRLRLALALNIARSSFWGMFFVYGPIYAVAAGESETISAALVSAGSGMLLLAPLFGWLANRTGVRLFTMASFVTVGVAVAAVPLAGSHAYLGMALLVAATCAGVALDAVGQVTFLRAVRTRERPEMGMVFSYYRDAASLLPHTVAALLLTFFGLDAVFLATAAGMFACAWLARWIPRGM
jgi:MFS family permease